MCRRYLKRGLSLIELLTATSILVLMGGAIAALAATVQTTNQHGQGHGDATQHARVALERIERALSEAVASPEFPGCAVFGDVIDGYRFPDTLVVWSPAGGAPANPTGRPLFSELVVFRVDSLSPNVLTEVTVPGYAQTAPALSDTAGWTTALAGLRTQTSYQQTTLTDLLRTATLANTALRRGAVRFDLEQTPSDAQIADFRSGHTAWKDLPWAQGIRGATTGLRQARCRIELQLLPGKAAQSGDTLGATAVPFFGSAALLYEVHQ